MTKKDYTKMLCAYPSALTSAEAAEILRISTKTLYKLIKEGKISAVKVGRENRISKLELVKYLQKTAKTSNPKTVTSHKYIGYLWTYDSTCDMVRSADGKYYVRGYDENEKHSVSQRSDKKGKTLCSYPDQGER